jgi:hypothetical protein
MTWDLHVWIGKLHINVQIFVKFGLSNYKKNTNPTNVVAVGGKWILRSCLRCLSEFL